MSKKYAIMTNDTAIVTTATNKKQALEKLQKNNPKLSIQEKDVYRYDR